MIDPDDLDHCRAAIAEGSYSFHAASKLLPARVRDPGAGTLCLLPCGG